MSTRFLRIAAVYFVVAVTLGLYMGMTEKFTQVPVHAHLNMLGWVSMALFGLIYVAFPAAGQTKFAMLAGNAALGPAVGITASVTLIGIVLFAINLWRTIPAAN